MKKRGLFVILSLFLIIFMISFALGAENDSVNDSMGDSQDVDVNSNSASSDESKGYSCLVDQIDGKSSLSLEEAIFASFALGSNSKTMKKIADEEGNDCWPKESCDVKTTSQVLLAYKRAGRATGDIESWLQGKERVAENIDWYLQIDVQSHEASTCQVKYDGSNHEIDIREDLTLSGSGGSCLSVSNSGYWLRIDDDCLNKEYEISCDDDFVTSLLYQKGNAGTIFVSEDTHSSAGLGSTKEKVESKCLGSDECDYEGTLWGALALQEAGEEVDQYLPYLTALTEDEKEFFPSAFLYILTGSDDYFTEVTQNQKQGKYWEIPGSQENRFYDTSLGLLALGGGSATEFQNAKNYLLDIQADSGCWDNDNIKSTGFVLYAGWPRAGASSGSTGSASCTAAGNYCGERFSCLESGGTILNNFECSSFSQICCSVDIQEVSCAEKSGILCSAGQSCDGATTSSVEGTCCLGACVNVQTESTCEINGGSCRSSCFSDEESTGDTCSFAGDVCCVVSQNSDDGGVSIWIWIFLLLILIVLVFLAIRYRNKIRLWMHKFRGRASSKPVQNNRGPPRGGAGQPQFRRMPFMRSRQRQPVRPQNNSRSKTDPDFEETMRKLRDMSK